MMAVVSSPTAKPSLPFSLQMAYAVGQLGWSLVMGIIANYLIYFYLPPQDSGLPQVIPDRAFFGFISIIGLVTMGGRLVDAVTDPYIATLSDRSHAPMGRRISFMARGGLPMVLFMILIFSPPAILSSGGSILWLAVTLSLYYIFYTVYVTPYFALIAELGHTPRERLNLSTYISFTFFLGTVPLLPGSFILFFFYPTGALQNLCCSSYLLPLGPPGPYLSVCSCLFYQRA